MPAPTTTEEFLELVRKSEVAPPDHLDAAVASAQSGELDGGPREVAQLLVRAGVLSPFQAEKLLLGKWRGFTLDKYIILEPLGAGGMGIVYLGEHRLMGHRVAIKVLPVALAENPWFLKHFYQEAKAIAALNHPNIVRAHDAGHAGKLHYLVMDYVDGCSLQKLIATRGPLEVRRAAHYVQQASRGLQHLHERGLVHRDIKPGNILLDRRGCLKILDLGLARPLAEQQVASKSAQAVRVGTDDYLAPEQIVNSDTVDIRADIYSLGATFYFLLTGQAPFAAEKIPYQKYLRHLAGRPTPIYEIRPDIPSGVVAVILKMMAKNPWDRFQEPALVGKALEGWTKEPIPAPSEEEMPQLSAAARRSRSLHAQAVPAGVAPATRVVVLPEMSGPGSSSGIHSGLFRAGELPPTGRAGETRPQVDRPDKLA